MKRLIFSLVAMTAFLAAWFFRWDVTPVPRADAFGVAYMVNRLTGTVYMLHGNRKVEVNIEK